MKMKKVKVPKLAYENALGSIVVKDIEVLLDEDDYKAYKAGQKCEDLDYGLSGRTIERVERILAIGFFRNQYAVIFRGKYQLNVDEIVAIQELMGLNNQEFATILGVDKGSFSNILKRGKLSRSVGLLVIERLGMELSMPGSSKRLVDHNATIGKANLKVTKEINDVRYGLQKKAS